jgi:hypothetical protein
MAPRTPSARQIKQGTAAARAAAQAAGQSRAAKRVGRAARDFWAGQQAAAGEYRFARPSLWFGGQGSLQQPAPAGVNKALYRAGNVAQDIMGHGTNARTLFNLHPADFTSGIVQTQVNRRTAAPNAFAQMAGFGAVGAMGFGSGNIGLDLRSGLRPAGYQSLSAPDPERLEDGTVTTDYTRSTNPAWDSFNRVTLGRSGRLLPFEQYIAERDDKARQHGLDPAELQGLNMLYKGGSDKLTGILDEQQFFSQNRDYVRRVGREQAQQTYQNLLGAYGEYADYNEYLGKPMSAFDYAKLKNAGKKPDTLAYEQYRQDTYDSGIAGGLIRGTTDGIEGSGLEARIMGYRVTPGGALAAVGATAAAIAYGQQRWGKGNGRGRAEYSNVEPPPPLAPDTPGGAAQQATRPPSNARGSGRSPSPSIAAAESVYARAVNAANQVPAERLSVGKIQRGLAKNSATAGLDSLARKQMAQQIYQQSMRSRQGQATQPQQQQQAAAPRSLAEQQALQRQQQAGRSRKPAPGQLGLFDQQQQSPMSPAERAASRARKANELMGGYSRFVQDFEYYPGAGSDAIDALNNFDFPEEGPYNQGPLNVMPDRAKRAYKQQLARAYFNDEIGKGDLEFAERRLNAPVKPPAMPQAPADWYQRRDSRQQKATQTMQGWDYFYEDFYDRIPEKGQDFQDHLVDRKYEYPAYSEPPDGPRPPLSQLPEPTQRGYLKQVQRWAPEEAARVQAEMRGIMGGDVPQPYQQQQSGAFPGTPRTPQPLTPAQAQAEAMARPSGAMEELMRNPTTTPAQRLQQQQQAQQQAMQQRLMGGDQPQPYQQQQEGRLVRPGENVAARAQIPQAAQKMQGWTGGQGRDLWGRAQGIATLSDAQDPRYGLVADYSPGKGYEGFMTYRDQGKNLSITSVGAKNPGNGSGRTMFETLRAEAAKTGKGIKVIGGDDAAGFYQRMGMTPGAANEFTMTAQQAQQAQQQAQQQAMQQRIMGGAQPYQQQQAGPPKKPKQTRLSPQRKAAQAAAEALGWDFQVDRGYLAQEVSIYNNQGQALGSTTSITEAAERMGRDAAVLEQLKQQASLSMQAGDTAQFNRVAAEMDKIQSGRGGALLPMTPQQQATAFANKRQELRSKYSGGQPTSRIQRMQQQGRTAAIAAANNQDSAPQVNEFIRDKGVKNPWGEFGVADAYEMDSLGERMRTIEARREAAPGISRFLDALKKPLQRQPLPPDVPQPPQAPDWRTAVPDPTIGMTPDQLDAAVNRGLYGEPGYVPDPVGAPSRKARIAEIYSKIRERANPALNGQDFRQEDVARLTRAEVMAGNYPAPQLERFELAAQKSIARNAAKAAKRAAKPKAPDWRTAVPDPTIGMTPDQLDAAVNRGLYGDPGYVPDPVPEAQGTGRAARITKPSSKPKAPDWRTAVPNPAIGMTPDQLDEAINRGLYGDPGYVPDPVQAPGAARIAKPPSAIDNQIAGLRGAMGATDQNMAAMKQRQADLAKAYGAPQGIDPAGAPGRRARFPGTNLGTPPSRAALGLGLPPQRPASGDELAARRLAKPPAPPKPPGTMGQVRAIAPDTVGGAFSELRGAMAATDQSMAAMKKRQAELAKKYGKPPAPEGPSLQELFRQADEIGSKYQDPSDPLDFNAKQGANRILGEAGWGEAMGKGTGKIRQLPTPRPPSGAPTLAQPGAVVQFPGPKPPAPRPYIESPRGERIKGLFTDLKELGGQKVERGPVAPPPQNVVRFPELSPPRPVKVLTGREARLTGRDTKAAKPLAPVQQLRPGQVEPPPIASKARMRKLLEDLKISAGMDPANTLPDPIPGKTAYFPPQPPAQNAPPMGTPGTVTRMGSRIPDPWRGPAIAPAPPVRPAPAVARPVPQLPAGRAGAIAALPAGRAGGALAPAARPGALSTPGFFGGDISGAISNQRGPAPKITPQLPGRIPAALPAGRTAQALPPARVATIPASRAMVEAPARAITPTAARLSGGMIQTGTPTARAMGGGAVINSGTKVAPPAATKLGKGLGVLGAGLTALSAANEFRRAQKEGAGLGESAARGVVTLATDTAAWVGEPLAKGLSGAAYSYNPANYVRAAQAAMGDKRAEQALRNSRQAAKSREAAISQGFANLPKMAVQGVMGLFSGKRGQQQAAKIAQDKRTTTPAPTRATAPAAMATAPIGPQLPGAGRTAAAPQSDFQKLFGPDGSLSPYGENMQSSLGEYGFNQLLKESYKAKTAGTGTTTSGKPANQRDYMGEARTRADAERYKSDGTVKVGLDRNLKEFQGKIGVAQINAGVGYDKNARVENVGLDANAKRLQGQMYVSDNDLRGKLGVAQINAGVGYDKNARVENVGLDRNLKELQGKLGVAKISAGVGYDKNAREENVGLDRNLKEYQGKVDVANISGGWDYRKGVDVERVKGSNRLAEVGAESAAKIAEGKAAQKAAAADRTNAWGFERVRQAQGRKATQQQRQADAATQRRAIANDQYLASVASSDATRQRAKVGHSEAAARNVERERLRTQERVARIGQRHDPTALINSALSSGPRRW